MIHDYLFTVIFSNAYTLSVDLDGSHSHTFKLLKVIELLTFDGTVVCDGVRGGSRFLLLGSSKER